MKDIPEIDIVAIAPHPDDVELACSGTLLKMKSKGFRIAIIDLTKAELSTQGNTTIRQNEIEIASRVLGVDYRVNLGFADGNIEITEDNCKKVGMYIRLLRPKICLIPPLVERHPDHAVAGTLLLKSIFLSGLKKWRSQTNNEYNNELAWKPFHVLHYMQHRAFCPDIVVNITNFFSKKLKAIRSYKSQFYCSDKQKEGETLISTKRFFDQIESRARFFGNMIGVEYGEPFLYNGDAFPCEDLEHLVWFRHYH